MRCPSCGRENQEHRQACVSCGAAMVGECPSCGRLNVLSQVNCRACGTPLRTLAKSAETVERAAPRDASPPEASPQSSKGRADSGRLGSSINGHHLKAGTIIGGRYVIIRLLGEGGSKVVYQASDEIIGFDVAIAFIKCEDLDDEVRARVRAEVRAMGKLGDDHPHVVAIYNTGEENGRPFIVMQYMRGGSIEDRLRETKGHRLDPHEVVRIADQICEALEHAHAMGIIHRDLKPANVWFAKNGYAKLGDFGLAIIIPQSVNKTASIASGLIYLPRYPALGSVLYMPPEQARGERPVPQSDLYSLGAMMYEMVTGKPPFVAETAVEIVADHINVDPQPPSKFCPIWPGLERLILRLLAKSPAKRPQSASEVREILARLGPESPWNRFIRWLREHLKPVIGLGATVTSGVIITLLASLIISMFHWHPGAAPSVAPTPARLINDPNGGASSTPQLELASRTNVDTSSGAAPGAPPSPNVETTIVAEAESSPAVAVPPAAVLPLPSMSPAASPAINPPPSSVCGVAAPTFAGIPKRWPPVPIKPCGADVAACATDVDACLGKARALDADAAARLAYVYLNGLGVPRDYNLAKNWSTIAAAKGNALGQDNLGQIYASGLGVTQDYQTALNYFQQAAAQNCALAQNDLGDLYLYGKGINRDSATALDWYRKAAQQNDAMGQNNLGYVYLHGLQKDPKQAFEWLTKSSAQGNPFAQDSLGYMYLAGVGVERDPAASFQCFKSAAAQGYAESEIHLAELYRKGLGVAPNTDEAIRWYCAAAAAGNAAAHVQIQNLNASCPSIAAQ
jgi:serine/threonine protein kinase/TPR repeat protein